MTVKRTARRTKVETLPEEERLFLRACYDAGMKGRAAVEAYEKKFGKPLPLATFYSWVTRRVLPEKIEAEQVIAEAAQFAQLKKEHPDIPEDVLLRGFLRQRQASKEFRESVVDSTTIIRAELEMRKRDIEERRVKAGERHNALEEARQKLKEEELAQAREKIAGAMGGIDGRELYLRAAQDVLKKLHTYKDLKGPLDARQEEIVAELAHSAEGFARKLEQRN
jgi:hypothetical protein